MIAATIVQTEIRQLRLDSLLEKVQNIHIKSQKLIGKSPGFPKIISESLQEGSLKVKKDISRQKPKLDHSWTRGVLIYQVDFCGFWNLPLQCRRNIHSQEPILRGQRCLSMGKSSRFMMQVAMMVSL